MWFGFSLLVTIVKFKKINKNLYTTFIYLSTEIMFYFFVKPTKNLIALL